MADADGSIVLGLDISQTTQRMEADLQTVLRNIGTKEIQLKANICYYCLHEFHILPHVFLSLPRQERAFIIAAINERIENEKKKEKELKQRRNHSGKRR